MLGLSFINILYNLRYKMLCQMFGAHVLSVMSQYKKWFVIDKQIMMMTFLFYSSQSTRGVEKDLYNIVTC